jgi:hypothetical protein
METARQPATALRDRAERHVFATLPELGAAERRVLALLELAGADRAAAARDTGLDAGALREAAARGRKALRRTRAPLAAAGRCERAEMLLSDRLDGGLDDREAGRWLRVHLDRCPRCEEHAALLDEAREALRSAFAAAALPAAKPALPPSPRVALVAAPTPAALEEAEPPAALEPPAAPPELAAAEEPRGRLRPVPPVPAAPPAVAAPEPIAAPAATVVVAAAPRRRRPPAGATTRAARVLAIVLVVLAAAAGIAAGISALDDSSRPQRAPWAEPGAPDLPPPPLSGQ